MIHLIPEKARPIVIIWLALCFAVPILLAFPGALTAFFTIFAGAVLAYGTVYCAIVTVFRYFFPWVDEKSQLIVLTFGGGAISALIFFAILQHFGA